MTFVLIYVKKPIISQVTSQCVHKVGAHELREWLQVIGWSVSHRGAVLIAGFNSYTFAPVMCADLEQKEPSSVAQFTNND